MFRDGGQPDRRVSHLVAAHRGDADFWPRRMRLQAIPPGAEGGGRPESRTECRQELLDRIVSRPNRRAPDRSHPAMASRSCRSGVAPESTTGGLGTTDALPGHAPGRAPGPCRTGEERIPQFPVHLLALMVLLPVAVVPVSSTTVLVPHEPVSNFLTETQYGAFDIHRVVRRLTVSGFAERQADTPAEENIALLNAHLATRADVSWIRAHTDACLQCIRAATEEFRTDFLKWMFVAPFISAT